MAENDAGEKVDQPRWSVHGRIAPSFGVAALAAALIVGLCIGVGWLINGWTG